MQFRRSLVQQLKGRLQEPRRHIQVLAGPRQVGKTTVVRQVLADVEQVSHYASADVPTLKDERWLDAQWEIARRRAAEAGSTGAVLVVDEAQKVPEWSELVKDLWDADTMAGVPLKVVLLGSAPLLIQRGLTESLAGRFEVLRATHWSFGEMRDAFGWDLDRYIYFGGYPGAAPLVGDEERWATYIRDSLIETTISRDVLLMNRVDKPALLRQTFELGCSYSGSELSLSKILGQLHDAGNTTTLANYLELLAAAGLLVGLQKYSPAPVRRRSSSPKLLALNTALVTALSGVGFEATREDGERWGRLVETAVGAHIANNIAGTSASLGYWRHRHHEVDLTLSRADSLLAIEVKSAARRREPLRGLQAFQDEYPRARPLRVGADGISLPEFLLSDPTAWL